jgi:endonuclease/exonuclease/phosphatase family metal-dependent hydrolase
VQAGFRADMPCDNEGLITHDLRSLCALALTALVVSCATPGPIVAEPPSLAACRTTVDPAGAPLDSQIRWIRPESPDERATLDDWCRSVGPAVVAASVPAHAAPATLSDLVVISWNVNVGAGDVAGLVECLRTGTLTGEPVTRFVLLLQEAFRRGPAVPRGPLPGAESASTRRPRASGRERVDIVEVASRLGLSLAYVPSMRNGSETDEDRGNAILSTEPLLDVAALELPFERQRRVAIDAAVSVDDSEDSPLRLRLTDVHLDNRAPARRLWLFASATRLRQARGLLRALGTTEPAVVGGDFNTWYGFDDPVFDEMAAAFGTEIPADRGPTFAGLLRLDHLFFRLPDGWRATLTRLEKFGSDHNPLMATVVQTSGQGRRQEGKRQK